MIGLQCAVCLHVQFAAAEFNQETTPKVLNAETMIGGTALCRLQPLNMWLTARSRHSAQTSPSPNPRK